MPAAASAQVADTASIAGVVRDASGAVLPGVTVEAASPALIDKVRTVVTDGQGLYRIVDLRPGVYAVTFSLPGFSTFRRDGLELTTGFTATINAELRVGTFEETITVTGESPVVDISNVRQQTTLARETLEALPTTGRLGQLANFIPGATCRQPGLAERRRPRRARQCLRRFTGAASTTTRPSWTAWCSVCRAAPSSSSTI